MQRKWHANTLLVGMEKDSAALETGWQFLQKLNPEPLHGPAIPLRYRPPKNGKQMLKYLYMNSHSSTIPNSQKVDITQRSING